jgi:hypothetical protein
MGKNPSPSTRLRVMNREKLTFLNFLCRLLFLLGILLMELKIVLFLWLIRQGYLRDLGIDWRITLSCTFKKWDVGVWIGSSWFRIGRGGGHL